MIAEVVAAQLLPLTQVTMIIYWIDCSKRHMSLLGKDDNRRMRGLSYALQTNPDRYGNAGLCRFHDSR